MSKHTETITVAQLAQAIETVLHGAQSLQMVQALVCGFAVEINVKDCNGEWRHGFISSKELEG